MKDLEIEFVIIAGYCVLGKAFSCMKNTRFSQYLQACVRL